MRAEGIKTVSKLPNSILSYRITKEFLEGDWFSKDAGRWRIGLMFWSKPEILDDSLTIKESYIKPESKIKQERRTKEDLGRKRQMKIKEERYIKEEL